jgi:hypothetical protein
MPTSWGLRSALIKSNLRTYSSPIRLFSLIFRSVIIDVIQQYCRQCDFLYSTMLTPSTVILADITSMKVQESGLRVCVVGSVFGSCLY